jgi:hypothetical protein
MKSLCTKISEAFSFQNFAESETQFSYMQNNGNFKMQEITFPQKIKTTTRSKARTNNSHEGEFSQLTRRREQMCRMKVNNHSSLEGEIKQLAQRKQNIEISKNDN